MNAPQQFLDVLLSNFWRGNAMRCISRSDTSPSSSPTPTLSTLPGAASAVLAPCPDGDSCFRFLTRLPSSHSQYHCNTCAQLDSTAGSIKKTRWVPFGYCPARVWSSHPTQPDVSPHLKSDKTKSTCYGTCLLYTSPSPRD